MFFTLTEPWTIVMLSNKSLQICTTFSLSFSPNALPPYYVKNLHKDDDFKKGKQYLHVD